MAIVGGGPCGAAAAITLARLGVRPLVLESRVAPELKVGECLPPSASPILERLGLAGLMEKDCHLPSYGNRSVWGGPVPVERDFIFGTQGHGWQLDRLRFEATLAEKALEEGADWRYGSRLVECVRLDKGCVLYVRTPSGVETIEVDFIIDATGRSARVARQFGTRRVRYDRLIGAALLFTCAKDCGIRDNVTLVEAVRSGWWYSARLPGDRLMAAYMTDADLAGQGLRHPDVWLNLLHETEHTRRRVLDGHYKPSSAPQILQANSSRLDSPVGECWLAAGDAAMAFDPLSSYGISSALGGGYYAATALADFFSGNGNALPSYEKLIGETYARYLLMHYHYYSLEQRWPRETFWRRRHERN